VKERAGSKKTPIAPVIGAALAVLCGWLLWAARPGGLWTDASYDYLFCLGSHGVPNRVTLILMDNGSFDRLHQERTQPWDRALHAQLLNRLADDGASLVVLDSFFHQLRDPQTDDDLAAALRRQRKVVLMAEQTQLELPGVSGVQPVLPADKFLAAAGSNNWGVAYLDPDDIVKRVVRRQWPYPSPQAYPSLPWTAAQVSGAKLSDTPHERWLRYYGQPGPWTRLSYQFALTRPKNYFHNQIVFIGLWPKTPLPDGEPDEFGTPYTRWTNESSGGVEILLTQFLNLLNGDSLLLPPAGVGFVLLFCTGTLLGLGLNRLRLPDACGVAIALFILVPLSAIALSYFTNYWFPWLIISGAQLPCAMACTLVAKLLPAQKLKKSPAMEPVPAVPGYVLFHPPFGEGAYGKVWLARAKTGEWHAVKAIYRARLGDSHEPFDREYHGVKKYQPISGLHPGLLKIVFVSEIKPDHFYYIMELGDSVADGWETKSSLYLPRDLARECSHQPDKRLPLKDCLRIGISICEGLEFLHSQGVTHRDLKPPNIIFVNGQPRLADPGLMTEIRSDQQPRSIVGTPGFMPPEEPGTVRADIYSLGMMLYVLATGQPPARFPDLPSALVTTNDSAHFMHLNIIMLKACQPNPRHRHASARELCDDLQKLQIRLLA
jgi:CHASE2 domain-containing sensor protein